MNIDRSAHTTERDTGTPPPGDPQAVGTRVFDLLFPPEPHGPGEAAEAVPGQGRVRSRTYRKAPHHPRPGHDHDDKLDRYCKKLLAELEKRCPGLLPSGPLPAGEIIEPLSIGTRDVTELFQAAAGVEDKRKRNQVIWEQAGSELLVHLKRTRVAMLEGIVLVGITVETLQTERVEVTVPFAVGTPDKLAGMVVTTEAKPRGPATIVDFWGEALTAFAWQLLLDVIDRLAARTGVDETGAPLLPGAVFAANGTLGLIPQAAHPFERSGP